MNFKLCVGASRGITEALSKNLSEELRKLIKILSERAGYPVGVRNRKVTNME